MGLATSCRMMSKSTAKSRVCILLSDGVNTAGLIDPITAIDIAKALKIKVYTIGIGTATGNIMGIDEPLMRKISGQTGGLYFRAGSKEKLKSPTHGVSNLTKASKKTSVLVQGSALLFVHASLFKTKIEL